MQAAAAIQAGDIRFLGNDIRFVHRRNGSGDPPVPATKQQVEHSVEHKLRRLPRRNVNLFCRIRGRSEYANEGYEPQYRHLRVRVAPSLSFRLVGNTVRPAEGGVGRQMRREMRPAGKQEALLAAMHWA